MTASAVRGAVCLVPQGKSPKGNRGLNHRIGTDDRHEKARFNLERRKSWDDTTALTMAMTTTMMTTANLGTGMVQQFEDKKDLVAKQLDAVRLVPQSPRGSKGTINTPMKEAVCLVPQSTVVLHLLLNASSFQFHIPSKGSQRGIGFGQSIASTRSGFCRTPSS
jgi:hypothetical protein